MQLPHADTLVRAGRVLVAVAATALWLWGAPANAASSASLVGQWRFDEGAGQRILDDGPAGLHGYLGATADPDAADPVRIPGEAGGALGFDDAFVRLSDAHALDLQSLTVEAVVRGSQSPGANRYLVSRGARGCVAGSWGLYTARAGGVAFYVFDGERYYVSATAQPADVWDGAWHRVAGTYDGSQVRMFVDGRPVGAPLATPPGAAIEYESMPSTAYFGTYVGSCQLPFSGAIDEFQIWSGTGVVRQSGVEPLPVAGGGSDSGEAVALDAAAAGAVLVAQAPTFSSCVVRVSRKRVTAYRRSKVVVRVTVGGSPLRRARLSVRYADRRAPLASARTNAKGSVGLTLRAKRRGRVRFGVAGRTSCTPAFVTVTARV